MPEVIIKGLFLFLERIFKLKSILIVEDNEAILKGLKYSLEQECFSVFIAPNIEKAKFLIASNIFDLIILDVTLPDGSGFDFCKFVKLSTQIPVLFLTAKDEEKDVVLGFDLGADDYVIKPFRTRELISRVNNIFRRYNNVRVLQSGNVVVDVDANRVFVSGKEVVFTALEYKVLLLLFLNIGKTVSRDMILSKIWDVAGNFVNDNTLTVYVKRIREKLGSDDVIKTVKGIGYRIDK